VSHGRLLTSNILYAAPIAHKLGNVDENPPSFYLESRAMENRF